MRILLIVLLFSGLAPFAQAADKATNLTELLEQVRRDRVLEQKANKLREAEFVNARNQQSGLLSKAKAQLAHEEQRSTTLNQAFEENEAALSEQEAILGEKSGSLGELFGTVKQVANDSRSIVENTMTSVTLPERGELLDKLVESKVQPTIDDLRDLWLMLQEEMTESGKITRFSTPVITAAGQVEQRGVTRIGVFSAFSDGKFLRYLPETGALVELGRQPVGRMRDIATEFEEASAGQLMPTVIDPTRGAIMALLVQKPNWIERIKQGGWIGMLILAIGAIGLLIFLIRFGLLFTTDRKIAKQRHASTASDKNPLGRILSVYDRTGQQDVETLGLKLDEAILREIPKIERGLIIVAIIAAIAPMLGLLGTVAGMIETFQSITLFGTGDPKLMSGGISQALVTTELGLIVAIPMLWFHSVLSGRSNRLVQVLDEESAAIIAKHAEGRRG
jgi:biopolymer transport protein ExbB